MPENKIVGHSGTDRTASRVSREWLMHNDPDASFIPETPIQVNLSEVKVTDEQRHRDKLTSDSKKPITYYPRQKVISAWMPFPSRKT